MISRMKGCIYVLTHCRTGKKYVGVTVHPKEREKQHLRALRANRHICKDLQHDFNIDPHITFEIVKTWEGGANIGFHLEKEIMISLKTYDERYGYNNTDVSMRPQRRRMGLSEDNSYRRKDWVTA